jgi:hypothetical protein
MYKFAVPSKHIPNGILKDACIPTPSDDAAVPEPAIVVTTAPDVIFLILLLSPSVTNKFPFVSKSTPYGF